MNFPHQYGLQYPVCKTPGDWLVVGLTMNRPEDRAECGDVHSLDIHLNRAIPPYTASERLRIRRVLRFDASLEKLLDRT